MKMNLKPQTVYISTNNKSDFQIVDPTFGISNAYVKTTYCLSKEELIELLEEFEESQDDTQYLHMGCRHKKRPTKEQFINNILNNENN